ncbi:hypothetical protein DH2020_007712 [Rehmannia glutinosa]|uniref:Transcription factor CBF/NF-Y/archaeal histone domain-containing protein n=1 Tax=Rehmannia glutinosa TaxID=99300 RepID=A0ABR0TYW5_REHGL
MELDKDIKKVNSEALFLIASSTELFLQFLAEISAHVVLEKKKRTVRVENLRVAVKRHHPTADFLLDSLPMPPQPSEQNPPKDRVKSRPDKKLVPFATRFIDAFLRKDVTDSEDKKQKALCLERYRRKDEEEHWHSSELDIEREEECGFAWR